MYKAEQDALFQKTNQGLIDIRNQEIAYYTNVYMAFGSQATMIGGFTYRIYLTSFESVETWSYHTQNWYWISTAITLSSAVIVIILTMELHIMAPGLALDGPVGSMVRAVTGMKEELPMVTFFFSLMMFSFFSSTVLGAWTLMTPSYVPTCSSFVFFVAAFVCTGLLFRIYYRFHWNKSEVIWDGSVDEPGARRSSLSEFRDSNPERYSIVNGFVPDDPVLAEANQRRAERSSKFVNWMSQRPNDNRTSLNERPSVIGLANFLSRSSMGARPSMMNRPSTLEMQNTGTNGERKINLSDVAMEGYLSKRIKSKKEFLKEPWERRYFVLNYRGEFYYYKSRPVYRSDPVDGREEKRPIELDDYLVKNYNSVTPRAMDAISAKYDSDSDATQTELEFNVENSATTVDSKKTSQSRLSHAASKIKSAVVGEARGIFQFKLVPLTGRELALHYGLRADTEEEFTLWLEAMQSVSIAPFEESYYSEK